MYYSKYSIPLGKVIIAADDDRLCGLWFYGQKYFPDTTDFITDDSKNIFTKVKIWLDGYFTNKNPSINFELSLQGSIFQIEIWKLLKLIPYGKTVTYGEIAKNYSALNNGKNASAQAVGGAVGHNPVSIIIPCHRVIGSDGCLTGYAGGIDKKIELLKIEKSYEDRFYIKNKK